MYFGTRCASFVGSFDRPTTAIVRIDSRIFRMFGSSAMRSTIEPSLACRLRFPREQLGDRTLQGVRQVQRTHFGRGEPADLRVFFVRNPRLALPLHHQEEVVSEDVAGRRIEIFIDSEGPRTRRMNAEFLPELPGERGRWLFTGDQVAAERIPHAREANRARPLP